MILVMVSNIANPFCAEVVKGIEEEAEKNGYRILLCNSGSDLARSTSGLQLLSGKMVDGIITMNALSSLPELTTMIGDAPWVQCAEYADTGSISCVGINDVEAAQGAVSRLADSGRRRIALINHDLSYRYARLRERGYKSVLHVHGLAYQQVTYAQDLARRPVNGRWSNCCRKTRSPMRCLPFGLPRRRGAAGYRPRPDCGCRRISR